MINGEYIFTVFITILTVIDPLGLIPVYLPLSKGVSQEKHNKLILFSIFFALIISTVFLFFGKFILEYLKIKYYSLFMVGGIILFKIGLGMIYSTHIEERKNISAHHIKEVSIFPLAVPMLSGPGTIATIIMFIMKSNEPVNYIIVFSALVISFLIAGLAMKFSKIILKVLGQSGISIIDRIMGIILCSLAIQFIANSIKSFVNTF